MPASGHAAVIDTSFHGPLESAATLGMLKTFQLMKPSPKTVASSPLNMAGAISWGWCHFLIMVEQHALIDWPLTPYTGWGAMEFSSPKPCWSRAVFPRLLACNDRSQHCDLHWLDALQYLEDQSRPLMQQLAAAEGAGCLPMETQAPLGFSPLGNHVPPPRFTASKRHVGVTFFECSRFSAKDLETLKALTWWLAAPAGTRPF